MTTLRALFLLASTLVVVTRAWIPCRTQHSFATTTTMTRLFLAKPDAPQQPQQGSNPCWEDLYDDDCAMSNVYAASFVAADWIKSMPCAAGIEDCDMPRDLTVPETRPEAGVEQVDVMDFLGLKRAAPIKKPLEP